MNLKKKLMKRLLSLGLSAVMMAGTFGVNVPGIGNPSLSVVQAKEIEAVTGEINRESIHDGAILHAFCWNFNTIKENMKDIAAAGYTAVQTSPINECLDDYPALEIHGNGMWYYHYQPTDWKIGNYQLGTRDEFKAMCDEAEKYGVGIIVDILPNHTTPTKDAVSQDLINASGGSWDTLLHKTIANPSGRVSTTYTYNGLLDVDTENAAFQQYFYEFLMDCLRCGADGFRVDTAKHIALPDDPVPAEYEDKNRNQFYPNMKKAIDDNGKDENDQDVDYSDLFVYGETLQGGDDRLAAYQDMLGGTTASSYGGAIRGALSGKDLSVSRISGYQIGNDGDYKADPNKLVTWVESHDTYCNDGEDSWRVVSDEDVRLGWAVIGARKDGTPLFFSRPNNSSVDNPWGDNVLGAAGNDEFKSPEVSAINHFRTAMAGKDEKLTNPDNNPQVLMIERGADISKAAEGAVIVNDSISTVGLECETKLADGTYKDAVSGSDNVYTVTNGIISGTVPARSVVVLMNVSDENATIVSFYNSKNWENVKAKVGEQTLTAVNNGDGWWSVTVPDTNFDIQFTDGDEQASASFTITEETGRYVTGENNQLYTGKAAAEQAIGVQVVSVYLFNTENWDSVNAYAFLEDGTQLLGTWPGSSIKFDGGFWYRADVKFLEVNDFKIIFGNGENQTEDIAVTADDLVEVDGKQCAYIGLDQEQKGTNLTAKAYASMDEVEEIWGVSGRNNTCTVYFYNAENWDKVGVYTWSPESFGTWPGTLAEEDGDGWYKITIPSAPSSTLNIIFNNFVADGEDAVKEQTGNLLVNDIKNRYYVGKKGKNYASKAEALNALQNPEVKEEVSKVYYYDENDWGEANLYIWSDNEEYQNCLGEWPGAAMTDLGDGLYSVDVPTKALQSGEANLIFNGADSQLGDVHPKDAEATYYTTTSATGDLAFTNKEELYASLGIEKDFVQVYFYNKDNWEEVYAYAWTTTNTTILGAWPGQEASYIGDGWWMAEVPGALADELNIIFNNNNNGSKTGDLAIEKEVAYIYTTNVVYDTKKEVEDAIKAEGETGNGEETGNGDGEETGNGNGNESETGNGEESGTGNGNETETGNGNVVDTGSGDKTDDGSQQNQGTANDQKPTTGTEQKPAEQKPADQKPAENTNQPQTPATGNNTTTTTEPAKEFKKGTTFKFKKNEYKIVKASDNVYEVQFVKAAKTKDTLTIPATVKYENQEFAVTSIGSNACKKNQMKKVVVGKNVKSIGKQAFYQCKSLKEVNFKGANLTTVGKDAFAKTAKKIVFKAGSKKTIKSYKKLISKNAPASAKYKN